MNELKEKIIKLCNESGLPLEAITFVIKDIYRDTIETYKLMKDKEEEE